MKKNGHTKFPGAKFYFTEADPSSQRFYGISEEVLTLEFKLWLLLADHLILSAGHMIKSDETFRFLFKNAKTVSEFAKSGAILPSLSDRYGNCQEYAHDQVIALDHAVSDTELPSAPKDRAMFLDGIFSASITWPASGESQYFREMIVNDLTNPSSPLRQRMRGVAKRQIVDLSAAIAQTEDFTRGKLTPLVRKHCPERERIIARYADCFYYLSGALFKDAFPVINAEAASLCREKISHAAQQMRGCACIPLWREIMDAWGVTLPAVDRLPLKEVFAMRRDNLGKRVRKTWGHIVTNARQGLKAPSQLTLVEEFQTHLVALFAAEVNTQAKRQKRWASGRSFLQIGSWVTGGIGIAAGLLSGSVASFATGVGSFLAGTPLAKKAEQRFASTELVLLAERIRKAM